MSANLTTPRDGLSLRFIDESLERNFREDYNRTALPYVRAMAIVAIIAWLAQAPFDPQIAPGSYHALWFFRFAFVCPLIALAAILSYFQWFARVQQLAAALIVLFIAAGISVVRVTAEIPAVIPLVITIFLLFVSCGILRVLFSWAGWLVVALLLIHELGLALDPSRGVDQVLLDNYFLFPAALFALMTGRSAEALRRKAYLNELALAAERARSDMLVSNMLPAPIAAHLRERPEVIAEDARSVSIIFADIVGFTQWSASVTAREVVTFLDALFASFDDLCDRYAVEKIKTIGDAYMVVAGLPTSDPQHASVAADFALELMRIAREGAPGTNHVMPMRVGIASGPVVAGVIGRRRYAYDVWGDTVNTASRMESHGVPGMIQISDSTMRRLHGKYLISPQHFVEVKGKGRLGAAFLLGRVDQ